MNGAAGGKIFGDKKFETEANADKATASFKTWRRIEGFRARRITPPPSNTTKGDSLWN